MMQSETPLTLCILPHYSKEDLQGDGGIRRVVEAQQRWLPGLGFNIVDTPDSADIIACHAGEWPQRYRLDATIVSHCHGLYWQEYSWDKWCHRTNRAVIANLLHSDACTAVAEYTARAIRQALWLEPSVIYNGVDPDDWTGVPHSPPYVLWNKSRIDPVCDPEPLDRLAELLPDTAFVTTHARRAHPNVTVVGRTSYLDAKGLIQGADVFLGTTRGNFEVCVLEAMASGVPILGWNWGSMPEQMVHKVHGWLAPMNDYADLVAGYYYIQKNRARMSKACIERVKRLYDWQNIIPQYAEVYRQAHNAA